VEVADVDVNHVVSVSSQVKIDVTVHSGLSCAVEVQGLALSVVRLEDPRATDGKKLKKTGSSDSVGAKTRLTKTSSAASHTSIESSASIADGK